MGLGPDFPVMSSTNEKQFRPHAVLSIGLKERMKNGTPADFNIISVDGIEKGRRQRIKNRHFWTTGK